MNVFLAVLWKDLVCEWRGRDRAVATLLFSLLVVVIFHFSLDDGGPERIRELAPGLLWIAYVFAAVLGLNRAFSLELENDAMAGLALAPSDRGFVFLGKAAANFLILAVVQALTALVFALVFDQSWWHVAPALAGVVALGSVGICSMGTLLSACTMAPTAPNPQVSEVSFGTVLPFGEVARVCDLELSELGQLVEEPSARGYRLFDSQPGSAGARSFYITGFADDCARQLTAANVLFGNVGFGAMRGDMNTSCPAIGGHPQLIQSANARNMEYRDSRLFHYLGHCRDIFAIRMESATVIQG